MIRIQGIFQGLVIGTEKYLKIINDYNPSDWITPLDLKILTKIKKIGTKKHFILQILRLVSLTEWELKIPNKPEKLNIVLLGMVLTNVQQSNIILKRIPDNYFFRSEILDGFLKRK